MEPLQFYKDQIPPVGALLPERDGVTFTVLKGILREPCAAVFTDHRDIVVCWSRMPFPVWVWLRDPTDDAAAAQTARCLREYFPLEHGHSWNLEQAVLERLAQADSYFAGARIKMTLLSHRLDREPSPCPPCAGSMERASPALTEQLAGLWHDLCLEMEGVDPGPDFCRDRVLQLMEADGLFLWRTPEGAIAGLAGRVDLAPFSRITGVYTLPPYRRQGVARNLVSALASVIRADGLTPILYTDGSYAPSNDCYRKIGFQVVGRLCTVTK